MLKLSLKVFRSFLRQRTGSFFLISIGMFVTMLGFVFIFSRGVMVYKEVADYTCETRKVTITTNENVMGDIRAELDDFLFENKDIPKIQQIMIIDHETDAIGYYSSGELNFSIPYGRYFNLREQNGSNVVLLSDAYLSNVDTSFLENMLNSTININDSTDNYTVIGRYNSTIISDPLYSQEVVIPLKTFIFNDYLINNLDIIFTDKPTKQQLQYIEDFLNNNSLSYSINLPGKLESNAIIIFLQETITHFIVLMICYITLLNLLRYWIKANYRKFYIYYMCGCSSNKILLLLLLNTCYMYLLPAALSLFFYRLMESYFSTFHFVSTLSVFLIISIYLCALVCALLTTWCVAVRQLKKFNEIKEIIY